MSLMEPTVGVLCLSIAATCLKLEQTFCLFWSRMEKPHFTWLLKEVMKNVLNSYWRQAVTSMFQLRYVHSVPPGGTY